MLSPFLGVWPDAVLLVVLPPRAQMFSSRAIVRTLAVAAMLATANAQSALQTGMEIDAKTKVVSWLLGGAL